MGLRLRKTIRILPGVKLNLSKTGASVSLGKKGMSYNIGKKGNRATLGLPGSGISYSTYSPHEKQAGDNPKKSYAWVWPLIVLAVIIGTAYFSS